MLTEFEESSSIEINNPGSYSAVCVELDMASLAVNTLLQVSKIHDAVLLYLTRFKNKPSLAVYQMHLKFSGKLNY